MLYMRYKYKSTGVLLQIPFSDWLRYSIYTEFSHDITAAILELQNNEMAAMLMYQNNPVGVQLFSYVNTFFCSSKFAWLLAM